MSHPADGFDAHLAHVLATAGEPGGACPDAETLAAWVDRTLEPDARQACEGHVGSCTRCQQVLAAMAFGEVAEGPAAAGPAAPATVVAFPLKRRLLWAAAPVALAASVALAVWVARDQREMTPGRESTAVDSPDLQARADAPAAPDAAPPQATRPRMAPAPVPPRRAREGVGDSRAGSSISAPVAQQATRDEARFRQAEAEEDSALRANKVAAPAELQPASPPPVAASAPVAVDRAAEGAAGQREERPQAAAALARAPADRTLSFSDPSGRVIWTITPEGRVTRRDDSGAQRDVAVIPARLLAATALSNEEAWAVGQHGAVWRTTDGQTWSAVASPAGEDLVAVSAAASDVVLVTTSSGRQFVTNDGGRSWREAP